MSQAGQQSNNLKRQVGVGGAIMMGLGSIVGTGVFVSVGIGYSLAGVLVLPAILVAAMVATLNGLSSAQLAAQHPVSGGTYAYGYRWLTPGLGYSAGVLFLIAKSASAATAALGCAIYGLEMAGLDSHVIRTLVAASVVVMLTSLVAGGLKRSNWMNIGIVSVTLIALAALILVGFATAIRDGAWRDRQLASTASYADFLQCCGLMFVAFTGYGRIATMGEEIVEPKRNIPRAIILTLVISAVLYAAIGAVVATARIPEDATDQFLSLKTVARSFQYPWLQVLIAIGALTAMLGVLLNLILGLSRVWFAMGRNHDMPAILGRVNPTTDSPTPAVILTGIVILGLTLVGDVRLTWSFSAFTVLVYYSLTNLAATRLRPEERLFPAFLSWAGLICCLSLAFFIDLKAILVGSAVLVVAVVARKVFRRKSDSFGN